MNTINGLLGVFISWKSKVNLVLWHFNVSVLLKVLTGRPKVLKLKLNVLKMSMKLFSLFKIFYLLYFYYLAEFIIFLLGWFYFYF